MHKILVIDDQEENVYMLKERLENEGYEISTAYNGKTGIEKTVNEKPDLVLLDVMMPEMSGLEVCRYLVKNPATSSIPIILVTAKVSAEDTREGLQAGAIDYIKKPINKIELLARVKSALKLRDYQKKILEVEKLEMFSATVVTANHKIKQPLTLIKLALAALKREAAKEPISRETIEKKLVYIETAVNEITAILNQFNTIEKPFLSNYVRDIKMVDLPE